MSGRFDAWRSSRTRYQAERNMQSLAFLWFDLELARGRLQEAFAEPERPVNTGNLNEPAGNPVLQHSDTAVPRPSGVEDENKYAVPLHTKQTQTNSVCGSLN
jgi:hypothetical protein